MIYNVQDKDTNIQSRLCKTAASREPNETPVFQGCNYTLDPQMCSHRPHFSPLLCSALTDAPMMMKT